MSGAAFRVIEPGLSTTVQDAGRFGLQRLGVPTAGAVDRVSWRLANALAGAEEGAAALEMRIAGPTLELEAERARIALVGAPATLLVDRAATGATETYSAGPRLWPSVVLLAGDRLRIGALKGATAYLAVDRGIDAPLALGSRSTSTRGGFGGIEGRALRAGDRVPLGPTRESGDDAPRGLRHELGPAPGAPAVLRAAPGPQRDRVTEAAFARFFEQEWRVGAAADRMGLRLEGAPLAHQDGHDIVSDATAAGAVQVPGDGKPILLLADRGTTGGYPKIACVISADLPLAGRLGPGAALRFALVTAEQGVAARRAQEREIRAAIARIGPLSEPGDVDLESLYRENLVTARAPDSEA